MLELVVVVVVVIVRLLLLLELRAVWFEPLVHPIAEIVVFCEGVSSRTRFGRRARPYDGLPHRGGTHDCWGS